MRTVYLDYDFKCHLEDDGEMSPFETDYFEGKCDAFIEGYRIIPNGMMWRRFDGIVFRGEMIAPWKPYSELEAAQKEYERNAAELEAAYQEGVNSAYDRS